MRKRIIVSTDLANDKRISSAFRKNIFRRDDGRSGVLGATHPNRKTVYVDVSVIERYAIWAGITFEEALARSFDHEFGHAFYEPGKSSSYEEGMACRFEQAGAWAR